MARSNKKRTAGKTKESTPKKTKASTPKKKLQSTATGKGSAQKKQPTSTTKKKQPTLSAGKATINKQQPAKKTTQMTLVGSGFKDMNAEALYIGNLILLTDEIFLKKVPEDMKGMEFVYKVTGYDLEDKSFTKSDIKTG